MAHSSCTACNQQHGRTSWLTNHDPHTRGHNITGDPRTHTPKQQATTTRTAVTERNFASPGPNDVSSDMVGASAVSESVRGATHRKKQQDRHTPLAFGIACLAFTSPHLEASAPRCTVARRSRTMGIDSAPLTTRCVDASGAVVPPATVMLDFTACRDARWLDKLTNHGMFEDRMTPCAFHEGVMGTYDTAKIWGYLEAEELQAWTQLFRLLFAQNPRVVQAQAHFFCTDEGFPYVILCHASDGVPRALVGSLGHCLYFRAPPLSRWEHAWCCCGARVRTAYDSGLPRFDGARYVRLVARHNAALLQSMKGVYWGGDVGMLSARAVGTALTLL